MYTITKRKGAFVMKASYRPGQVVLTKTEARKLGVTDVEGAIKFVRATRPALFSYDIEGAS